MPHTPLEVDAHLAKFSARIQGLPLQRALMKVLDEGKEPPSSSGCTSEVHHLAAPNAHLANVFPHFSTS